MAGFSHLPQQMEHGLITNNGFLFCHGSHGGAATTTAPAIPEDASMETSSVVLDTSPQDKKRKPREEDTASLNSAHSKVEKHMSMTVKKQFLNLFVFSFQEYSFR